MRYLGRRLALALPTLVLVLVASFLMIRVAPGDPAEAFTDEVRMSDGRKNGQSSTLTVTTYPLAGTRDAPRPPPGREPAIIIASTSSFVTSAARTVPTRRPFLSTLMRSE